MNYVESLTWLDKNVDFRRRLLFFDPYARFTTFQGVYLPLEQGFEYDLPYQCIEVRYHIDGQGSGVCLLKDFVKMASKTFFQGVVLDSPFFSIAYCFNKYTAHLYENLTFRGSYGQKPVGAKEYVYDKALCKVSSMQDEIIAFDNVLTQDKSRGNASIVVTFCDAIYQCLVNRGALYRFFISDSDYTLSFYAGGICHYKVYDINPSFDIYSYLIKLIVLGELKK